MNPERFSVSLKSITELRYESNNLLDDLKSKQQHLTQNFTNLISKSYDSRKIVSNQNNADAVKASNAKKHFHVSLNKDPVNKELCVDVDVRKYESFAKCRIINDSPLDEKNKIYKRKANSQTKIKENVDACAYSFELNSSKRHNKLLQHPPNLSVQKHVENIEEDSIYDHHKSLTSSRNKVRSEETMSKHKENVPLMQSRKKSVLAGGQRSIPAHCKCCKKFYSATEVNYADTSSCETVSSFSPPLTWSSVSEGSSSKRSLNSHSDLDEKDTDKVIENMHKSRTHGISRQHQTQEQERMIRNIENSEPVHGLSKQDSLRSHYADVQRPVLGYDWIANLLNSSDRSVLHRPPDFFQQLQEFRDCNLRDCIGFDTKRIKQDIMKEERGKQFASKSCTHKYKINSRLFPDPCIIDEQGFSTCTVCKLTKMETSWRPSCTLKIGVPQQHLMSSLELSKVKRQPNPNSLSLYQNCNPFPGYKGKVVPCMRLH